MQQFHRKRHLLRRERRICGSRQGVHGIFTEDSKFSENSKLGRWIILRWLWSSSKNQQRYPAVRRRAWVFDRSICQWKNIRKSDLFVYFFFNFANGLKIQFTIDAGSGPDSVNYTLPEPASFCDGHWHSVKVGNLDETALKLNNSRLWKRRVWWLWPSTERRVSSWTRRAARRTSSPKIHSTWEVCPRESQTRVSRREVHVEPTLLEYRCWE